jgi:hypothetical protein
MLYFMAIAQHIPQFTIGGRREAEITVPIKAFTAPPIVTTNTTAVPAQPETKTLGSKF